MTEIIHFLRPLFYTIAFLIAFLLPFSGYGAVISGGDAFTPAPSNSSAPSGGEDLWGRTIAIGSNSGVYVGYGWFLTANHVYIGENTKINYGGTAYDILGGVGGQIGGADLKVRKVDLSVGGMLGSVAYMPIDSTTPDTGNVGVQMGYGRIQTNQYEEKYLVEDPENPGNYFTYYGYPWTWDGEKGKRWDYQPVNDISIAGRFTTSFVQQYGFGAATQGDSGSPLFTYDSGEWVISGVAYSASMLLGSGDSRATPYGSSTSYYVDLADYYDEIMAYIGPDIPVPEPGSLALLTLSLIALQRRRSEGGISRRG